MKGMSFFFLVRACIVQGPCHSTSEVYVSCHYFVVAASVSRNCTTAVVIADDEKMV
jgi:hypothetical protein